MSNVTPYYIRIDNTTKNRKLHKFAITKSNFGKKIDSFRHASWYNVHVYKFSAKSG